MQVRPDCPTVWSTSSRPGGEGSEYLVRHGDIDKVSFTGSVATGGIVGGDLR